MFYDNNNEVCEAHTQDDGEGEDIEVVRVTLRGRHAETEHYGALRYFGARR